ncbi:hypothetical protein DSL17_10495, partial [Mycobacterium tuberculosis]
MPSNRTIVILLSGVRPRRFSASHCCNAEYHGISDVDESCCNSWGTAAVVASGGTVDDTVAAAWPASAAGLVVTGAAVNGVNSVAIA